MGKTEIPFSPLPSSEIKKPILKIAISNETSFDYSDKIGSRSHHLPSIPHGYSINDEIIYIKNVIEKLSLNIETVVFSINEMASEFRGEDMSDEVLKLSDKINDINLKLAEITPEIKEFRNRLDRIDKKLDDLPTKSDMNNIVNDFIIKLDLPRKDYIGKEINGLHLKLVLWLIGVTGVAATIMVRLLK